jgi:rhodanese-related sulfurtransferase
LKNEERLKALTVSAFCFARKLPNGESFRKKRGSSSVEGSMNTVTVKELKALKESGESFQLVDVRTLTEFAAGHVSGAVNIPMDEVESRLEDLRERRLLLICKSGKRARMTAGLLAPCRANVAMVDGGTDAWRDAGFSLVRSVSTRWSLERQVRLIAGMLVIAGTALALTVNARFMWLSGVVGAGLTIAGLTDMCMMASVLGWMPWNKPKKIKAGSEVVNEVCS